MSTPDVTDDAFARWLQALDERHLANLRVQEVTRALRALSSVYVERRDALARGAALDSAGKRAAFALFYGPLHYLLTRRVVDALGACKPGVDLVVDVGCGTGAAGSAWAVAIGEAEGGRREAVGRGTQAEGGRREAEGGEREASRRAVRVVGIDRHPWAVTEARWTYRAMGLNGSVRREDVARARLHGRRTAIALAFTVNELADSARAALLPHVMRAAREGARILVIEPVARSIGAWWAAWAEAFRQQGGREDTWRFDVELPERVRQLDRAAGLDHRVLTARSLFAAGEQSGPPKPTSAILSGRARRRPRALAQITRS